MKLDWKGKVKWSFKVLILPIDAGMYHHVQP
jgi:hypothetical protein